MEYLSEESGGRLMVAKKYDKPEGTLQNWINKYQSGEFKLSLIQYRQINDISYTDKPRIILI